MPKLPARPQQPARVVTSAPVARSSARSASYPITECWWQCGWAMTVVPTRLGGVQPPPGPTGSGAVSSSARVWGWRAIAAARGTSGSNASLNESGQSTTRRPAAVPVGVPAADDGVTAGSEEGVTAGSEEGVTAGDVAAGAPTPRVRACARSRAHAVRNDVVANLGIERWPVSYTHLRAHETDSY